MNRLRSVAPTGPLHHRSRWSLRALLLMVFALFAGSLVVPANPAAAAGVEAGVDGGTAIIIDMGVTPQTIGNGLKPYGLVYALAQANIPVLWVIDPDKAAKGTAGSITDGVDLVVNSKSYRGGPFVIQPEFYALAKPIVTTWQSAGVVADEIALDPGEQIDLPVYKQISGWPNTVLDLKSGTIAAKYYVNAGIPANSYRLDYPSNLTPCDDIYIMPHADPTWANHQNLIPFVENGGYFWAGCHAVSVVENLDDPTDADLAPDMNFLTTTGAVAFGAHDGGTPPYTYPASGAEPVLQFIGDTDDAHQNGSEQIYMPKPGGGWRANTTLLSLDPSQADVPSKSAGPASALVYGPAFGDPSNGYVMYEGGHSIAGTGADQIAAQRGFFNFHLLAGVQNETLIDVNLPTELGAGDLNDLSADITGGEGALSYTWSATCAGTFTTASGSLPESAGTRTINTSFTPDAAAVDCVVRVIVTDGCNHKSLGAAVVDVVESADLSVTKTVSPTISAAIGDTLTYTITATANGPAGSTDVQLTDTLPVGVVATSIVTSPNTITCSAANGEVQCAVGDIANGSSVTVTIEALVTDTIGAVSSITNSVEVSQSNPDPDPTNNIDDVDIDIIDPQLSLVKTASKVMAAPGDEITYSYELTNNSTFSFTDVQPSDDKCSPITAVDSEPDGFVDGDLDSDDELDPSETWLFECTQTLDDTTTNVATFTAVDPGGITRTVVDDETVRIVNPGLSISKSPDEQSVASGGTAVFTIKVSNTGDVDLHDIVVTDPLTTDCARTIASLQAGASTSWSCTLTNVTTDFTNVATATAPNPDGGTPLIATDDADVVVAVSELTITKVDDVTTFVRPGDSFNYTITIKNTGNTTQTGIAVNEVLPAGLSLDGDISVTAPRTSASPSGEAANQTWGTNFTTSSAATGTPGFTDATWTEIGESDGAAAGTVKVLSNRVEINNTSGTAGVSNEVDLSGYDDSSVYLMFDCSGDSLGTGESVAVKAGTTTLATYGPAPAIQCDNGEGGGANRYQLLQIPSAEVSSTTLISFTKTSAGGNKKFKLGQIVVLTGVVAYDTFETDFAGGTGWATSNAAWTEVDAGSEISVVKNQMFYNAGNEVAPATLTRNVALPTATYSDAAMWFDCRHASLDKLNDEIKVSVGGTAVYRTFRDAGGNTADPNPCGSGAQTLQGPYTFTAAASVPVELSMNNETKDVRIDNVIITASTTVTEPVTTTTGTLPDPLAAEAPYELLPGEEITITIPVLVDDADQLAQAVTEFVNLVEVTSTEEPTPKSATEETPLLNPRLAVDKSVDRTEVASGDEVTYTVVVSNIGNAPLTPPDSLDRDSMVADPLCTLEYDSGDTNADLELAVDEQWVFTCTVELTADTTNTVTANADDPEGDPVAEVDDSVDVDVSLNVIQVVLDPVDKTVRTGSKVDFTYTVTNPGEVPLANVSVTDPNCADVDYVSGDTNTDGKLDLSETWLFECTSEALDADIDREITATGVGPTGKTVDDTDAGVVDVIDPSISVVKTADETLIAPSEAVVFTVEVTNTGDADLTDPVVTDSLCSLSRQADDVGNDDEVLEIGEVWIYTCTMNPTDDVTNTASASFTDPTGEDVSDSDDEFVNVKGAGFTIVKVADATIEYAGETVSYTFSLTNTGETNFDEADLTITDTLCTPSRTDDSVGNDDAVFEPGEDWRYTCEVEAAADDVIESLQLNEVSVSGIDELDTPFGPVTDAAQVMVIDPSFAVEKTASDTEVWPGTEVVYTYVVTNTSSLQGSSSVISIDSITDDECSPVEAVDENDDGFNDGDLDQDGELGFVLEELEWVSEEWEYTCSDTLTVDTTNTVTVTGTDWLDNEVEDATDTVTVDVLQNSISVTKQASTLLAAVGSSIQFVVTVVNTGDGAIANLDVDDPMCTMVYSSGDTNVDSLLDLTETWIYRCTYVVTPADLVAGRIDNTVTVTGEGVDEISVDDVASAALLVYNPELPTVGSEPTVLVAWALALIGAGLGLVVFGRRRRPVHG